MKHIIVCKQCGTENPFYQHICGSCKSYLRERVVNIDLWQTIGELIESPQKAFSRIIFSEHKNFIFFIIMFAAVKLLIDVSFISLFNFKDDVLYNFFGKYIFLLILFAGYLYLFSLTIKSIDSKIGLSTRVKDHFSILVYSFIPHVFALFMIFIIELVVFGGNLFSHSPSPFFLKPTIAYTLLVFEFLVTAWGIMLTIKAEYAISGSVKYSLFVGLLFNLFLFSGLYLFSLILF